MNIQIITFSLEGISEQDYLQLIESAAHSFAELPGLVSKTWLANAETNTYGGVYLWQDRESMEGYPETDVFK
jgi:heme-degrading monooxygenase HmoA